MSTLPRVVRDRVEREPDREVFRFRDLGQPGRSERSLDYAGLWRAAGGISRGLEGLGPGRLVLVILPLGPEVLAAHLGVLLAGCVPSLHAHPSVKLSAAAYARNLRHVLETVRPGALITSRRFADVCAEASPERLLLVEDLAPDDPLPDWESARAEDLAVVQHSSGSTGLQKGVPLTHAQVLAQCAGYADALGLRPQDRICSWLPLYHDMGLFTSWLLPLLQGVPVAAIDPFAWVQDPVSFLRLLAEQRGTLAWQPNFAYDLLAARATEEELAGLDLSCVRGLVNCAEPVRAESHRRLLERLAPCGLRAEALWVCYAMAENAFAVTAAGGAALTPSVLRADAAALAAGRYEPGQGPELVSVGRPLAECEVRVVSDARAELPAGQIGELAVRSPFTLRAYLDNPQASAAAIDAEGWFYTGDLGLRWEDELYVTGRIKDLLIVGGRNFYPQDLERIADACPGAIPGRAAAVGVDDPVLGTQRVLVLVESHEPEQAAALGAALRRQAMEQLDCAVTEVRVVPHMWLPKTTSGKIARRASLERYLRELAPAPRPPRPERASALETAAWTLLLATVLYLALSLAPNPSWGIYAGF